MSRGKPTPPPPPRPTGPRRQRLVELDRLTAQLRDRTDAWCRQLRHLERTTYGRDRRDRGRIAQVVQQATVAALLAMVGLFLAVQPGHQEPAPVEHHWSRPATAAERHDHLGQQLTDELDAWRAHLDADSPQPRVGRRALDAAGRLGP